MLFRSEQLTSALLSHSRLLRLSTLRLLSSPIVRASEGTVELLKKALQAEEISVDVQGVRERVLRIGRLPLAVKDGDDVAADICARWLIGVFLRRVPHGWLLTVLQPSSR